MNTIRTENEKLQKIVNDQKNVIDQLQSQIRSIESQPSCSYSFNKSSESKSKYDSGNNLNKGQRSENDSSESSPENLNFEKQAEYIQSDHNNYRSFDGSVEETPKENFNDVTIKKNYSTVIDESKGNMNEFK